MRHSSAAGSLKPGSVEARPSLEPRQRRVFRLIGEDADLEAVAVRSRQVDQQRLLPQQPLAKLPGQKLAHVLKNVFLNSNLSRKGGD